MENIYIPKEVNELAQFYGTLLNERSTFPSIKDHLYSLALKMWEGIQENVSCIKTEFNNYHPEYLGLDHHSSIWNEIELDGCLQAIASEYGYKNWVHVENKNNKYYEPLQSAIDYLLQGDQMRLKLTIEEYPEIINRPVQYGHQACLIHYCASNGVEMWRQKVPLNLTVLVNFLIDKGADTKAMMKVYGGHYDVMSLARTSIHPSHARISESLMTALDC